MLYDEAMNAFEKVTGHLSTINAHKRLVTALCFRCGLYKQGILHDLSKYTPVELKTGFRYYQGFRSPINAQKEDIGYSASWLHHKGRNPHHWEYWLDNGPHGIQAVAMPFNYVVEMFCDRVAASMVYEKEHYTDSSALHYYLAHRDSMLIHPQTEKEILFLLEYLEKNGLDAAIGLIRTMLKEWRKTGKITFPAKWIKVKRNPEL